MSIHESFSAVVQLMIPVIQYAFKQKYGRTYLSHPGPMRALGFLNFKFKIVLFTAIYQLHFLLSYWIWSLVPEMFMKNIYNAPHQYQQHAVILLCTAPTIKVVQLECAWVYISLSRLKQVIYCNALWL